MLMSLDIDAQQAQRQKIDSLLIELNHLKKDDTVRAQILYLLVEWYINVNPDSAYHYNQQALALSERLGYVNGVIKCYRNWAAYYNYLGQYEQAIDYIEKAYWLADSTGRTSTSLHLINDLNVALAAGGEIEKGNQYLKRGIKIAQEIKEDKDYFIGLFYHNYGNNLRTLNQDDSALYYLETSYDILVNLEREGWGHTAFSAISKLMIGIIHLNRYNYPLALESYFKALELATSVDYRPLELDAEMGIARVYRAADNTRMALERLETVYREELATNLPTRIVIVEGELTRLYHQKEDYPKVIEFGNKTLKRGSGINNRYVNLISITNLMAYSYLRLDSLEQAMKFIKMTDSIHQVVPNRDAPFHVAKSKVMYHTALNEMDSAYHYIALAMKEARSTKVPNNIAIAAGLEYEYYKGQGKVKEALQSLELKKHITDSLESLKNKGDLMEISSRIETAKKQLELENQEKEISLLQSELRSAQLQKWGIIIGSVLVALIAGLVIINLWRKIQNRKQIAQLEKKHLQNELELKQKEVVSNTLLQAQKNQLLNELLTDTQQLEHLGNRTEVNQLKRKIKQGINTDKNLEFFRIQFEKTHEEFYMHLRSNYPKLSPRDLQLCALIRLNFSNKEMAALLNIEVNSAQKARHRLRQRLELEPEVNLSIFLQNLS